VESVIRRAEVTDAADACQAVRRSIVELCVEDHGGDRATIAAWLANKTPENVAAWIASPDSVAVVAQTFTGIVGSD
jgi:hypothetical protein